MKRNIISFCILASVLLITISAAPLVNSFVVEKNINRSLDIKTTSTEKSLSDELEGDLENKKFDNNRDIVNYVGDPIWIYDSDLYVRHVETADLNGDAEGNKDCQCDGPGKPVRKARRRNTRLAEQAADTAKQ